MATNPSKTPPTNRRRKSKTLPWWKRLFFAFVPLGVLLVVTEIGLRLAGFSYNPDDLTVPLFLKTNTNTWRTNPYFTDHKLFEGMNFSSPREYPLHAAKGALRVLMVGGSSVNELDDAPRLAQLLNEKLDRPVEIINMGMGGVGSERVLLALQQGMEFEPDVVMVYTGHNEFISITSPYTYETTRRGMRPAYRTFRTLQLLGSWQDSLQGPILAKQARHLVRVFRPEEKELVYQRFRKNLTRMVAVCNAKKIPVILGVVSSNRRLEPMIVYQDWFATSTKTKDYFVEAVKTIDLETQAAEQAMARGDYEEALHHFDQATLVHPRPYRADKHIREIIRSVAADMHVPLVDVDALVLEEAHDGIPGSDLFEDRCHLNGRGKVILQEAFASAIAKALGH